MTKSEWISTFRDTLMAEIPQNEIDNNIAYYRDYIDREAESKPEETVLQTLGEPRLIAKTIIDTYQLQRGSEGYNAYEDQSYNYQSAYEQNQSRDSGYNQQEEQNTGYHHYQIKTIKWYHKAIIFAVLALIIVLLVIIGGVILRLFFTIGLPVLIVVFLIQMIRRR